MITVEVRGPLRAVTGRLVRVEGSVGSVRELAEYLAARFGEEARRRGLSRLLTDFFAQNIVLVNGVEISALDGEGTRLRDGDRVVVLNLTHGG